MATKVTDLPLEEPLQRPSVSARYDAVRLLVRHDRMPVGVIQVPNTQEALAPSALRTRVRDVLSRRVWAQIVADELRGEDDATAAFPISVVVCTRNRPDDLRGALRALCAQTYPLYETIVVDNAPSDGATQGVAAEFSVRYVQEPRPGLDWARNRGLDAALAPIVAYTDDDARADPDWLAGIAAGFSTDEIHCVTGLVVPSELETRAQSLFEDVYGSMSKGFAPCFFSRRGRRMVYEAHRMGVGTNMAFRKEALERLGGFDPALDAGTATGGAGDLDMLQRVLESDAVVAYRPDAIVRHRHRRTVRGLRRQVFDNGRGFSAYLFNAFRRARGLERLRVVLWGLRWLWQWHLVRLARKAMRREKLPLSLVLAEFCGMVVGPAMYAIARRRARILARSVPNR